MRVLIDYRPALRGRSGVGEYVHGLARALAVRKAAEPDDDLVVTLFSSSWKDRLLPSAVEGLASVDCRVPVSLLNLAWHRLGWPPAETLTGGRFDVVHSLHPLLMPARHAAQVVTILDLNFLAHPERTQREIRRDYPALTARHAARADHIIVPSLFTAREVERLLQVPADKVSVCPPGAPAWTPRSPSARGKYVLFLGTLEPRKNLGALLDAYERWMASNDGAVPDLVLAGRAIAASRLWLERIARPPLAGRVRHVGYVEEGQLRALYEGARLLVQPSFEEGFGIPVLEAMAAGVPVVAANRGSLPEVLGDAGLLVDPDNIAELSAAMRRLSTDASLAASCAAAGIARAARYRWDLTARIASDAYRRAAAHRAARLRSPS